MVDDLNFALFFVCDTFAYLLAIVIFKTIVSNVNRAFIEYFQRHKKSKINETEAAATWIREFRGHYNA